MEEPTGTRKSHIEPGTLYFWTATINGWKHLLADNTMKMEIIKSLQWLTGEKLIEVYAYVIMPNHIHLVWTIKRNNGKESPHGSFLKFTAHQFRKILTNTNPTLLKELEVSAKNKSHEFWQRDSLAIPLYGRPFLLQKIKYIHNNPVAKHWQLSKNSIDYPFSSANYYETGIDQFGFLSHIGNIY